MCDTQKAAPDSTIIFVCFETCVCVCVPIECRTDFMPIDNDIYVSQTQCSNDHIDSTSSIAVFFYSKVYGLLN